jgi:hypothetical protein
MHCANRQSADKHADASNRLISSGLMVVSSGFTLYPTRLVNNRLTATRVAAPRVYAYPHTPYFAVDETRVANSAGISGQQLRTDLPDVLFFDVTGYDISADAQVSRKGAEAGELRHDP